MNTKRDSCNVAQERAGTEGGRVMGDRELLELAAKAVGMKCRWWKVKEWAPTSYSSGSMRGRMFNGYKDVFGTHHSKPWDPINDDGDALRLAVSLEFEVSLGNLGTIVYLKNRRVEEIGEDGCDAMSLFRRAIIRAAAEIGKGL